MKKICCMILFLAMILGCVTVSGYAVGESVAIGDGDTTVTLTDGSTYRVIRTADEFLAMESGEKYILANDINFGGRNVSDASLIDLTNIEIDGNHHALLNYSSESGHSGMFAMYNANGDVYEVTLRNLSFGSETQPISLGATSGNGGSAVVVPFVHNEASVLTCENVKVYADIDNVKHCVAGFVGRVQNGTVTLTNCEVYGSIATTASKAGGFIGRKVSGTVTLTGCVNHADVTGGSTMGGLIGNDEKPTALILTDCINKGKITSSGGGCGGLIGNSAGIVQIKNCDNQGTLAGNSSAPMGSYLGVAACTKLALVGMNTTDGYVGQLGDTTEVQYRELFVDTTDGTVTLPEEYVFNRADISENATTVDVNGATYQVIRTANEMVAMSGTANYILANDIDFGGRIFSKNLLDAEWDGILDGNGYKIHNFSFNCTASTNNGMFLINENSHITVRNLTVGSSDAVISFKSSSKNLAGVLGGVVGSNSQVTVENVHVWAAIDGKWELGGFFGRADSGSSIVINSCSMNGTVNASNGKVGGFIGTSNASELYIYNTVNNASVTATAQNNAGFVGLANTAYTLIEIISCVQRGDVTTTASTYSTGGFVGKCRADLVIANSRVDGAITMEAADDTAVLGLFAGEVWGGYMKLSLPLGKTDTTGVVGKFGASTNQIMASVEAEPISSAADFAQIKGSGWYRLESDLVLTEAVEICGGNVTGATLDLNGKSLTGNLTVIGGTLVIGNGSLISESDAAAITAKGDSVLNLDYVDIAGKLGVAISESANVTVGGEVTVVASDCAVLGTGTEDDSVLTVKGAELTVLGDHSEDSALRWDTLGTLNVSDGKISAAGDGVALEWLKGTVLVSDGVFSGKYALVLSGAEDSCLEVRGGSFKGTSAAILDQSNLGEAVLSGGAFEGDADGAFASENFTETVYVTGGVFDEEIPREYLHEYISVKNEDGSYTVAYHTHDYTDCRYEAINVGSHNKFCTVCNAGVSEPHKWGAYTDDGEGKHYRICSDCKRESTRQAHTEQIDEATGNTVCSVCGVVLSLAQDATADSQDSDPQQEEKGCGAVMPTAMLSVLLIGAGLLCVKEKKKCK